MGLLLCGHEDIFAEFIVNEDRATFAEEEERVEIAEAALPIALALALLFVKNAFWRRRLRRLMLESVILSLLTLPTQF